MNKSIFSLLLFVGLFSFAYGYEDEDISEVVSTNVASENVDEAITLPEISVEDQAAIDFFQEHMKPIVEECNELFGQIQEKLQEAANEKPEELKIFLENMGVDMEDKEGNSIRVFPIRSNPILIFLKNA